MSHKQLYTLARTENHIHIALPTPRPALSSAVLNGGWVQADHIVNMHVPDNYKGDRTEFQPPEATLADYSRALGLSGCVIGMMTAAWMSTFRQVNLHTPPVTVTALVTAGISNAKQAGEPAEWRRVDQATPAVGTINLILLTNLRLTQAAMVEAVMVVTEAKTVALGQLGITSPTSGQPATGTGTDSVVIVSGMKPPVVRYCGKHVLLGEMMAQAAIRAITSSLTGR